MTAVKDKKSYVNHSKFLDILWKNVVGNSNKRKIRLISLIRSDDWLGDIDDDWFGVILPDFHLLSDKTQKDFSYGFNKLSDEKNVDRLALLDALVQTCLSFRDEAGDVKLEMFHLGDFIDLWREEQSGDRNYQNIATRVLDLTRFSASKFYANMNKINFLLGNHDQNATEIYPAKKGYFPVMKKNKLPLLITHGDIFDKLEALDDNLQKHILNLVQKPADAIDPGVLAQSAQFLLKLLNGKVESHRYELIDGNLNYHRNRVPLVLGKDEPLNRKNTVNVLKLEMDLQRPDLKIARVYHQLLAGYPEKSEPGKQGPSDIIINFFKRDTQKVKGLIEAVPRMRKGETSPYEKSMQFHLPPNVSKLPHLKVVVVGHTHWPGLVTVGDPHNNGFLLVDCGAWIEEITWPVKRSEPEVILPSCQFGVLCGNEARVYQLDP